MLFAASVLRKLEQQQRQPIGLWWLIWVNVCFSNTENSNTNPRKIRVVKNFGGFTTFLSSHFRVVILIEQWLPKFFRDSYVSFGHLKTFYKQKQIFWKHRMLAFWTFYNSLSKWSLKYPFGLLFRSLPTITPTMVQFVKIIVRLNTAIKIIYAYTVA